MLSSNPIKELKSFIKDFYLILLVIPVIAYLWNFPPALTFHLDSSEHILQAYKGGIDHPCGYPIYLWVGSMFMFLSHQSIYSMHYVSLVFSVLTLISLFLFMKKMGISREGSILSVLIFAFNPMFMRYSLFPGAYNVNAFFIILVLFFFYSWTKNHHNLINIFAGSFIYGLSLGVYFPNILMIVPIAVFICYECVRNKTIKILPTSFFFIAIGAIGPMIYIYLRSKVDPPVGTMYNPDNIKNFFLYITGVQYDAPHFNGWVWLKNRLIEHSNRMLESFLVYGLLLSFFGIFLEWKKNKGFTLLLMLSFLFTFIFFSNFRVDDYYVKVVVCYLIITIFLAVGLNRILTLKNVYLRSFIILLVCSLIIFQAALFLPRHAQFVKENSSVTAICKSVFNILPKDAIVFAHWNYFTNLLCVQTIFRERQDITFYEATNQLRNYIIDGGIKPLAWRQYIDQHINEGTPIYTSSSNDTYLKKKYLLIPVEGTQLFPVEDTQLFRVSPKST
jgi:hypothetical protein